MIVIFVFVQLKIEQLNVCQNIFIRRFANTVRSIKLGFIIEHREHETAETYPYYSKKNALCIVWLPGIKYRTRPLLYKLIIYSTL